MDTSSTNDNKPIATVANGVPAIIMPGTPAYQTAWEAMMRKKGHDIEPPLDHLGRVTEKAKEMAAKTTYVPANDPPEKKVLVFRDHNLELPELHLRVFLTGPEEDRRGFPALFSRAFCECTEDINDADLVVFTGGPDVDPAYYGEKPVPSYCGNDERDYEDVATYLTCYESGIPMLGICRGAQFLAVMQQGKLVQDLDGHKGDHKLWDCKNKDLIEKVSSVHHQAVHSCPGMEVLATTFESTEKWLSPTVRILKRKNEALKYPPDIEAYYIPDTCSIGIQGHPEYKGYHAFAKWTLKLLDTYICTNPSIEWVDINDDGECRRRIRADLLLERELRIQEKINKASSKPNKQTLTIVEATPENEIIVETKEK